MSYEYITSYDSPNFGYPDGTRGQNVPQEIVIHHWGSDEATFNGTVGWLCNPASQVSAHFVVEAGRVACLVNWNDAAWHAGSKEHNKKSIGIECHPRCSDADMQTVAEVIALMWKEYGKLPLVGHKDVANTGCPGRWYSRLGELEAMAEAVYGGGELPDPIPEPDPEPTEPAIDVDGVWGPATTRRTQKKLGCASVDGVLSNQYAGNVGACIWEDVIGGGWNLQDTVSSIGSDCVRAIQKLVGVEADGVFGPATIRALQRFLGITADGVMGPATVRAWQNWLNS